MQVHGAICAVDGKKTFTDVTLNGLWTGWSGFADTFDQKHRHQVGPSANEVSRAATAQTGTSAQALWHNSFCLLPGHGLAGRLLLGCCMRWGAACSL